jgi:F0F1-type ATP synthase assembly protein I
VRRSLRRALVAGLLPTVVLCALEATGTGPLAFRVGGLIGVCAGVLAFSLL